MPELNDQSVSKPHIVDVRQFEPNYTPQTSELPLQTDKQTGLVETINADFRYNNPLGQIMSRTDYLPLAKQYDTDASFNLKETLAQDPDVYTKEDVEALASAQNQEHYNDLKAYRAKNLEDRGKVDDASFTNTAIAGFVNGLRNPVYLAALPATSGVSFAGVGASKGIANAFLKTGKKFALASTPPALINEYLLNVGQRDRSSIESVANVAGEVGLAYLLSGVAGSIGYKVANIGRKRDLGERIAQKAETGTDANENKVMGNLSSPGVSLLTDTDIDDIASRAVALRARGTPLVDNSGRELPDFVDPTTTDLYTQRDRVKVSDEFLNLYKANGNSKLDNWITHYNIGKDHPKWNYSQKARAAIDKYINDVETGDKDARVRAFKEWEAQYNYGEYQKAADRIEGVENADSLAKDYDIKSGVAYGKIADDVFEAENPRNLANESLDIEAKAKRIGNELVKKHGGEGKLKGVKTAFDKITKTMKISWEC